MRDHWVSKKKKKKRRAILSVTQVHGKLAEARPKGQWESKMFLSARKGRRMRDCVSALQGRGGEKGEGVIKRGE